MSRGFRRFALSAHLTFSIGWIGGVVAYLVLGIAAVRSTDSETIRAAWVAMDLIGWYAIIPMALASLLTGLVMALGTKWGLFRHYWVVFSFAMTVVATTVLLFHMPTVSSITAMARQSDAATLQGLGGDLGHPAIGLGILLVVQYLNLYKPKGMTRYGQRKQNAERAALKSCEES